MEKVESRGFVVLASVVATLLMLPAFGGAAPAAAATTPAAAATGAGSGTSNCTRICGNISIPYPFGVEPGCYHAAGFKFNLTCDNSYQPAKLFLGDGTVQVLEISLPNATVRVNTSRVAVNFTDDGVLVNSYGAVSRTWGVGLPQDGPYFLSESGTNSMVVASCDVEVDLLGGSSDDLVASCTAFCPKGAVIKAAFIPWDGKSCQGIGCCKASVDIGYTSYNISIRKRDDGAADIIGRSPTTDSIYIADESFSFTDHPSDQLHVAPETTVPTTLSWAISNSTCPDSKLAPECISTNSYCGSLTSNDAYPMWYVCNCTAGYEGNPYISDGCKDIDECTSPRYNYLCYGQCTNTPGSYLCQCPSGYTGNATVRNGCQDINECEHKEAYSCYGTCQNFPGSFHCQCPEGTYGNSSIKGGCIKIKNSFTGLSIGLGIGGGTSILFLGLGGPYIMRKIKHQKVKKMKQRFFKQNHGLLLQQLISRKTDIGERMIITLRDIEKATNNFDRARIIGGGGHGVVFKGILDLQVVAIKKSKIVVQREINEFINEVAVLSQVNHRNVVRLLGCCLETEVPLLVYEFISNGTLCHHLHVDGHISLPWDDRMRIATEVAKALSYLHSAASMPIFHRDIKSANILLDDALTAKVSDFGSSKYIPIDQAGVTTAVQGTMGYLDPMYFYTGRLTDKSDVFSFGVLLVELLTRKKPYVYRSANNDGLVSHFVSLLVEGKLVDIIDPQVMEEEGGEIQEVATLAAMCTKLKGEDRPTMREVEMTLESLLVKKRPARYNGTLMRTGGDQATTHYMTIGQDRREASRQYTMEEEILLSASYPG